ncbi:hypothetical protein [Pedomonas mirosovicensis]|uniref:hypothetical protein n=1 Tax=Pedomonas mirosovicensis TaxID=2908641 RepID=UPI00216921D0|nr:hypothetical protein [Pedomonas mirosovicensis]MCH8686018.1 hypothetical protein [Pedomonas mirosovicensis]
MTVDEAAVALGAPLRPRAADEPPGCWITRRADGRDPGIAYMVVEGRIRRIDVQSRDRQPAAGGRPDIITPEGIGIGMPEAVALRVYGTRVHVVAHPYTGRDGGHYLIVDAPRGQGGLIFETYNKRITGLRAGWQPEIGYVEGCS